MNARSHPTSVGKPLGKRRALIIAIQRVGKSKFVKKGDFCQLVLTHRDARELRQRLISSHGYLEDDIILMMDDAGLAPEFQPTRKRIVIDHLIHDHLITPLEKARNYLHCWIAVIQRHYWDLRRDDGPNWYSRQWKKFRPGQLFRSHNDHFLPYAIEQAEPSKQANDPETEQLQTSDQSSV